MFDNLIISVGQLLRRATHLRHFNRAVRQPWSAQRDKLMQILRANESSLFGQRHHFGRISSVEEFQSFVPPSRYEDLSPYIEGIIEGRKGQLTCEQPIMFATTSGTTGKPKFIPITLRHLKDYTHAFQIHNYQMIRDYPQGARGRFLIITSNDEEGAVASGLPYGAVSGMLNRQQSPFVRKFFALPYELCKVKDIDAKYYLMLRLALCQPVTAILCCNPSSLILLADQLKEHGQDLIKDIFDGTIKKSYLPRDDFWSRLEKTLGANRKRAYELGTLLSEGGNLLPSQVWPNLALISCWKGGPMSFYLDRLPEYYGDLPIRDFGYMASEGRGSIPLSNDGAGGVVALTSHFFEFVHEDEIDSVRPKFLTVDKILLGQRYFIYFTTEAGLYRYNINDLIEVVGFYERTPLIRFVRKGTGISSITGEKVTEEQVQAALQSTVKELKLSEIKHFTAAVRLGTPPLYSCFVELHGGISESVKCEFIRMFDLALQAENQEYRDKRASRRLGAPRLVVLPAGTYTMLRQRRVLEGAPEAQVKIPLLTASLDFENQIDSLLAGSRSTGVYSQPN